MERKNALEVFKHWLPDLLDIDIEGGHVKLDRAHCSPYQTPSPDQRQYSVIIWFHSFPDKQTVMEVMRRKARDGNVILDGRRISFYPDLSTAVFLKRRDFDEAKQCVVEIEANYSRLFPSKQ